MIDVNMNGFAIDKANLIVYNQSMKILLAVALTLMFTSNNPTIRDTLFSVVHQGAVLIANQTAGHDNHKSLLHVNIVIQ